MTQEEFLDIIHDFLDTTEIVLSRLGLIPLEMIFMAIIGGITIVSYI
jgi:hypothetical protein